MKNIEQLLNKENWIKYLELADEGGITNHGIAQDIVSKIQQAINYIPCCTQLKNKEKLTFDKWKFSKGIRYVSGHNYKDNDGDLYDSDELEKMYEHYLNL